MVTDCFRTGIYGLFCIYIHSTYYIDYSLSYHGNDEICDELLAKIINLVMMNYRLLQGLSQVILPPKSQVDTL